MTLHEEMTEEDLGASVDHVFDQFVTACTCKSVLSSFHQLLDLTGLRHADHAHFYQALKGKLQRSWKAQSLWAKLDKRAAHRDYKHGPAASNMKVLVIGAGPCGLRSAIECALLGFKTVLVEKRDRFSRNNVLHLWPFLITDLRNLGAKKFFGKFCAGSIDHISIRQLQCILMKVALLFGVEIHVNVSFDGLVEPPEDQTNNIGWRCKVTPESHALSEFEFDVLVGADGKRNTLPGFKRKEFRGKLAIAITANFINRNSQAEASVEEISGVAFIFNQKFFLDLKESTRIDLENIVYYKDDTHYFVMTAKKASLLEKGVLKEDYADTLTLLDRNNVNQDALMAYAKAAANFSTNNQLPHMDYAVNHYGQADVAMFDFTSMFAAENASRFILKNGHHLLLALVGDSLLEPFWPTGSGCARGFLGAFDAAWMIKLWASGKASPLQVLAERESIFTILSQTTPNYLHKNYNQYSIDPNTRYPNLNTKCVKPRQVHHLYEGGVFNEKEEEEEEVNGVIPTKKPRNAEEMIDSYSLLRWCQRVLNTGKYRDVHVLDFTSSWRSGLALCALIHSFRPDLVNLNILMESDVAENNQLAFNLAEKELGIPPVMSGADMVKYEVPDKLTMVAYLSQFYQLFRQEALPSSIPPPMRAKRKSATKEAKPKSPHSPNRRISFLQKLSAKLAKSKKRKEQESNEASPLSTKRIKEQMEKEDVELLAYKKLPMEEIANRLQLDQPKTGLKVAKTNQDMMGAVSVTAMADLLAAKFKDLEEKPAPEPTRKMKGQPALASASSASEFCSFCHKRVYIMERMSAEGEFFHRHCFKCDYCNVGLRLNNYACDRDVKPVKFYCYRHAVPQLRIRQRKRFLEEEAKENIPSTVITPSDGNVSDASRQKSPRKTAPSLLSPLAMSKGRREEFEKLKRTPERVEFEISFDGQEEESEEEQFEHNLRASMSSDTLQVDEDSDSDSSYSDVGDFDYLSESEMALILNEWSEAEDDVWETAGENLSSPGANLTLEEACELVDSWRQQRSQELGVDFTASTARRSYRRLQEREEDEDEEEGEEDADDAEGSSTEVEESDYESDGQDETEKQHKRLAHCLDDFGSSSLMTPTSPLSRLSTSKANFFSEPPKVVSLDPWSMFGMGNKAKEEAKGAHPDSSKEGRVERKPAKSRSSSKSREDSKKEELSVKEVDVSAKDTDVSESLEFDWKSRDDSEVKAGEKERRASADSLDELEEEIWDEKEKRGGQGNEDVAKEESEDENANAKDHEEGGEGDDEKEEEEEMLEKTQVKRAMEKLLVDIDHKAMLKVPSFNKRIDDSSDSDDNERFVEGRLSPSANKTRKFRMKRNARQQKERRSGGGRYSSESEHRTDPTTTDNSAPRSSISRSPSADLDWVPHIAAVEVLVTPVDNRKEIENGGEEKKVDEEEEEEEDAGKRADVTLPEVDTLNEDDTLRQVLESIAAMPDLSESSDIDDLVVANLDDRFVTKRNKKKMKKEAGEKEDGKMPKYGGDNVFDSSFSISTPSDSQTSVTSMDEEEGQTLNIVPGDDDIKPDRDMLQDYQTTLSLALGESYSDETDEELGQIASAADKPADADSKTEEKNAPICVQEEEEEEMVPDTANTDISEEASSRPEQSSASISHNDSVYVTPEGSMDAPNFSSSLATKSADLKEADEKSEVPKPTQSSSPTLATKFRKIPLPTTSSLAPASVTKTPARDSVRDSSGSEVFLSPLESFSQSPFPASTNNSVSSPPPSSLPIATTSVASSTPILSQENSNDASTPLSHHATSKSSSSSTTVTSSSLPSSSTLSSSSQTTAAASATTTPVSSSSIPSTAPTSQSNLPSIDAAKPARPQRKLPELPKLKTPSTLAVRGGNIKTINVEPSKFSAPTPPLQLTPATERRNLAMQRTGRALPNLNTGTATSTTTTPTTVNGKNEHNNLTSTPTGNRKIVKTRVSKEDKTFSTPISPPTFKPPKTVVQIDKNKLKQKDSDTDLGKKKRISAEGISIMKDDDIPFADDGEEEEKFYTPHDPGKHSKTRFPAESKERGLRNPRKRILPNIPPENGADPTILSVDQIREIKKTDLEKAKSQARERARLKSDEDLGLEPNVQAKPLGRQNAIKMSEVEREHRSSSFDTPTASDILSDSDDILSSACSPPSSAAEVEQRPYGKKEGKKKTPKSKKDGRGDTDKEGKEKRKSLLSLILPSKASKDHGRGSDTNASSSTPKGSDDNLSSGKSKGKRSKAEEKKKKKAGKSKSQDSLDDHTPVAENRSDLAICSIFHAEASKRPQRNLHSLAKRTVPLAPKASIDDFSDSDESHVSMSTMRRMDDNLDERVARRLRKIQLKQQRQAQQKRLRMAQEIQRQLEEVEVRQRDLEERGTTVEKALRGDAPEDEDIDEAQLMSEWFTLVHEKNALLRYESELNVRAKELELEDRQARLEIDFRDRSRKPGIPKPKLIKSEKTDGDIAKEGQLLDELLDVVEQRNNLVAMLEDDRLREQKEDKDLEDMMFQKGFVLSPLSYDTRRDRQKITAPLASPIL